MTDAPDTEMPVEAALAAVLCGLLAMGLVQAVGAPILGVREALLLGQGLMLCILLATAGTTQRDPLDALAVRGVPPRGLALAFAAGTAMWLASAGLLALQYVVWPPDPEMLKQFERLHESLELWPPWNGALSLLAIAIGPAISEELAFRGALLGSLRRRLGDGGAVAGSALLFGLIHVWPGGYRVPFTIALGLALGLMRVRAGSVVPCIVSHAVLNATTVIVTDRLGEQAGSADSVPAVSALALLLAGAGIAALFMRALPRAAPSAGGTLDT